MSVKYLYDSLSPDNYLLGDGSVEQALNDSAITLAVSSGDASQAVSLEGFEKIAIVYEGTSDVTCSYLELIGNQSAAGSTIEIVADSDASSGFALKMTGEQTLIFGTPISYVPSMLKKITLKAKSDAGNTTEVITASVVAYKDKQFLDKSLGVSLPAYVKIAVNENEITDSYATYTGYVKETQTGGPWIEPANSPDNPAALPTGTEEIALILEIDGGSFFVDVISLEEVENSIRDIPDGTDAYSTYTSMQKAFNDSQTYQAFLDGLGAGTYVEALSADNLFATTFGAETAFIYELYSQYMMLNRSQVVPTATVATEVFGSGSTTTALVLGATASAVDDTYNDQIITVRYANDTVEFRVVTDYVGATKTATVVAVPVAPVVTDSYSVAEATEIFSAGSTTTTLNLGATASATNDVYNGHIIRIVYADGSFAYREILDYVGATKEATVSAIDTAPTTSDHYSVGWIGSVRSDFYNKDGTVNAGSVYDGGMFLDADGRFMLGDISSNRYLRYDPNTGELDGNVAYDEWDLVIDSDAKLALLTTGATTYKRVLITNSENYTTGAVSGKYATSSQIDLDAHSVEAFVGFGKNCQISINYTGTAGVAMIKGGSDLLDLGNFRVYTTATTHPDTAIFISINNSSSSYIHDLLVTGLNKHGRAFVGGTTSYNVKYERCNASYTYYGFYASRDLHTCKTSSCNDGFVNCDFLNSSKGLSSDNDGFVNCDNMTICWAYNNTGDGFSSCENITGSLSTGNTGYGFNGCDYITSTKTTGNTAGAYDSLPSNEAANNWS